MTQPTVVNRRHKDPDLPPEFSLGDSVPGIDYGQRDINCRLLGFPTYRDYLLSKLWKKLRKRVFREKGGVCSLCFNKATAVHHNRYHCSDLIGVELKYLFPICESCHERIEFKDGTKRSLESTAGMFDRLLRERNKPRPVQPPTKPTLKKHRPKPMNSKPKQRDAYRKANQPWLVDPMKEIYAAFQATRRKKP